MATKTQSENGNGSGGASESGGESESESESASEGEREIVGESTSESESVNESKSGCERCGRVLAAPADPGMINLLLSHKVAPLPVFERRGQSSTDTPNARNTMNTGC